MRAEEAMEAADGRRGRGRKRALPGALEGEQGQGERPAPLLPCAQLQQQHGRVSGQSGSIEEAGAV
jgi:hypothetical protein